MCNEGVRQTHFIRDGPNCSVTKNILYFITMHNMHNKSDFSLYVLMQCRRMYIEFNAQPNRNAWHVCVCVCELVYRIHLMQTVCLTQFRSSARASYSDPFSLHLSSWLCRFIPSFPPRSAPFLFSLFHPPVSSFLRRSPCPSLIHGSSFRKSDRLNLVHSSSASAPDSAFLRKRKSWLKTISTYSTQGNNNSNNNTYNITCSTEYELWIVNSSMGPQTHTHTHAHAHAHILCIHRIITNDEIRIQMHGIWNELFTGEQLGLPIQCNSMPDACLRVLMRWWQERMRLMNGFGLWFTLQCVRQLMWLTNFQNAFINAGIQFTEMHPA